jgi:hypothetical protein
LHQGLLAQLGSSPRAGGKRRELANLLARHPIHPLRVCRRDGGDYKLFAIAKEKGGEDRNRTYPATCVATTVLKTARATRHPSLSETQKTSNVQRPTSNVELRAGWSERDDYLIALMARTMASKSGQSPESSLEWRSLPLARISKAPPLEGMRVSDLMRSPSSRILAAKLTALGV